MKIKSMFICVFISSGLYGADNRQSYEYLCLSEERVQNINNLIAGLQMLEQNQLIVNHYQTDAMKKDLAVNVLVEREIDKRILLDNEFAIGRRQQNKSCLVVNTKVYTQDGEKWLEADKFSAENLTKTNYIIMNLVPLIGCNEKVIESFCVVVKEIHDKGKKVLLNVEKDIDIETHLAKYFPEKNWGIVVPLEKAKESGYSFGSTIAFKVLIVPIVLFYCYHAALALSQMTPRRC